MNQLLSALCLIFLLILVGCGPADQTSAATSSSVDVDVPVETSIPVEVVDVKLRDVSEELQLTGVVEAWDEYVVSSEIPGRVTAIHVDRGDWVEEGQLLIELNREKRELGLESRQAELSRAEVQLEFARKRLARAEVLLEKGAISQSEVDSLSEQVDLAESRVRLSRIEIETIERELADTRIMAPVSGQVSNRTISSGETVSASTPLIEIIELDPVRVATEVAESYLQEIRTGQSVELTFDALGGVSLQGRIHRILPVANSQSGAFPVDIQLSNPNHRLLPGMMSRVRLQGRTYHQALLVPLESVLHLEGSDYIFIVEDNRARRIDVEVKHRVGEQALVDAPLDPGEKVVTRGNSSLTEGARVEIIS